jgi:molecular chaperone DnaK (HSP70)
MYHLGGGTFAVQAAMLMKAPCSYILKLSVNDVLPMPIYAFENLKPAVKIFKKNIRLPCFKKKLADQLPKGATYSVVVYHGLYSYFKEEYVVNQIESLPFESIKFHFNFELDLNGILTVAADVISPSIPQKLTTIAISKRISKLDMERFKRNILVYLEKEKKIKTADRLKLKKFIPICDYLLSTYEGADLEPDKVEEMIESCTHYLLWLQKHYHLKARLFAIFTKQRKQQFQEARINLEKCLLNCDERLQTTRNSASLKGKFLQNCVNNTRNGLKPILMMSLLVYTD